MKTRKIQMMIDVEIAPDGMSLGMIVAEDGAPGKVVQQHEVIGILEMLKQQVTSNQSRSPVADVKDLETDTNLQ